MIKRDKSSIFFSLLFVALVSLILAMTVTTAQFSRSGQSAVRYADNRPAASPIAGSTVQVERKIEIVEKLNIEADGLLTYFDEMPHVPVYLADEPIIKAGSATQKGVAYTTCENKNEPTIYIKKDFYEKANQKQIINILKHELTHSWLCRQGIRAAHDERFRRKFKEAGGFGN